MEDRKEWSCGGGSSGGDGVAVIVVVGLVVVVGVVEGRHEDKGRRTGSKEGRRT